MRAVGAAAIVAGALGKIKESSEMVHDAKRKSCNSLNDQAHRYDGDVVVPHALHLTMAENGQARTSRTLHKIMMLTFAPRLTGARGSFVPLFASSTLPPRVSCKAQHFPRKFLRTAITSSKMLYDRVDAEALFSAATDRKIQRSRIKREKTGCRQSLRVPRNP